MTLPILITLLAMSGCSTTQQTTPSRAILDPPRTAAAVANTTQPLETSPAANSPSANSPAVADPPLRAAAPSIDAKSKSTDGNAPASTGSGSSRSAKGPIYTGPRGGRYHYSASGKKVYERKRR